MWKLTYYAPLAGFVLPTVAIGYGVVIPRSCIAGFNELTVGFATTVLGAALTYVAGIRAATRKSCPASMPWRVRVGRAINRQASAPRGLFGRFLTFLWSFEHRKVNRATVDRLALAPNHRVLEIGCGPGVALAAAAERAAYAEAVDVSETVVAAAARRNRAGIAALRVAVRRIDGTHLELQPESFDRVFSVHCIYFWKDAQNIIEQLALALRPGGRLVLCFRPDSPDVPARFRDDPLYRFYASSEVERMLTEAGFADVRTERSPGEAPHVAWVIGVKSRRSRLERGPAT
jgi:SAM-dependent methyltransferase